MIQTNGVSVLWTPLYSECASIRSLIKIRRLVWTQIVGKRHWYESTNQPSVPPASAQASKPLSLWSKFDETSASDGASIRMRCVTSLRAIMSARAQNHSDRQTSSPFAWWAKHAKRFLGVAAAAGTYLCIPATSVASERLFSKAGDVVTKKRNSLKPSAADRVVFLTENLRRLYFYRT